MPIWSDSEKQKSPSLKSKKLGPICIFPFFNKLIQLYNCMSIGVWNTLYLIIVIINPKCDLIFCRTVCVDIGADKIIFYACSPMRKRQNVMDIPTTFIFFAVVCNSVIFISIAISAHQIAMKIYCKLTISIMFFPELKRIVFIYFHNFTSPPWIKTRGHVQRQCVHTLRWLKHGVLHTQHKGQMNIQLPCCFGAMV